MWKKIKKFLGIINIFIIIVTMSNIIIPKAENMKKQDQSKIISEFSFKRQGKILKVGSEGEWDKDFVAPENVTKVNGIYYCVYEGRSGSSSGIGIAYSKDLKIWTKHKNNPIIKNCINPSPHIFYDNLSKKWYVIASGSDSNIHIFESDDVGGKYIDKGSILNKGNKESWDSKRVLEPFLYYENGTYYLFYMGDTSLNDPHEEQIGLATSDKITGPYKKCSEKPILGFGEILENWDSRLKADPWIYKNKDGYYYMGYAGGGLGGQGGGEYEWKTGIVRSKNIYGPWKKCMLNPIMNSLSYGDKSGIEESKRIWRGSMFDDGNNLWFIYGGKGGNNAEGYIALVDEFPNTWTNNQGIWERISPCSNDIRINKNGQWIIYPQKTAYDGNLLYSTIKDDYLEINFFGKGIRVRGRVCESYAIAGYTLDNNEEVLVDSYAPKSGGITDGIILYSKENIPLGEHKLKIKVSGTRNKDSKGKYIGVDLFEILH